MRSHPVTNFEIQKYYHNEPRFNGVYSRDNSPKIKNGAYVINLDVYSDIETHWVALYVGRASPTDVKSDDIIYFDHFRVEHIPKEIKIFTYRPSSIKTNIFRIKAFDSILYTSFCIGFIDFMLAGKTLTEFSNLFSPYNLMV